MVMEIYKDSSRMHVFMLDCSMAKAESIKPKHHRKKKSPKNQGHGSVIISLAMMPRKKKGNKTCVVMMGAPHPTFPPSTVENQVIRMPALYEKSLNVVFFKENHCTMSTLISTGKSVKSHRCTM